MLVAEDPGVADGLLLSSYPLHPPGKPERMRTEHLPDITVPTVIVHGSRDPFATTTELAGAIALFTAPVRVVEVTAPHDLKPDKTGVSGLAAKAVAPLFFDRKPLQGAPLRAAAAPPTSRASSATPPNSTATPTPVRSCGHGFPTRTTRTRARTVRYSWWAATFATTIPTMCSG